jgi:hypothetical protein
MLGGLLTINVAVFTELASLGEKSVNRKLTADISDRPQNRPGNDLRTG